MVYNKDIFIVITRTTEGRVGSVVTSYDRPPRTDIFFKGHLVF